MGKTPPPARRVYHEWEDIPTQPDYKLEAAFESTNPKYDPNAFTFEDVVTNEWFGITVAGVLAGLLIGRWWVNRYERGREVLAWGVRDRRLV